MMQLRTQAGRRALMLDDSGLIADGIWSVRLKTRENFLCLLCPLFSVG
jgi:hypothetical protein